MPDYKQEQRPMGYNVFGDIGTLMTPDPSEQILVQYAGTNFDFHAPAEHTIDGEVFDLELQIVHYATKQPITTY